jgi:hypothetical protein
VKAITNIKEELLRNSFAGWYDKVYTGKRVA